MSDRDDQDDIIRNPETRRRRAWIDRAIDSVRRRLESGEGIPEADETDTERPKLYVVRSGRHR
jgi:hypothetical protein